MFCKIYVLFSVNSTIYIEIFKSKLFKTELSENGLLQKNLFLVILFLEYDAIQWQW